MPNIVYLPQLDKARLVRAYHFQSPQFGPHCCVLLTDCESESPVQYAHVMVVNRGVGIFGQHSFAVASEINKRAAPGSGCSYFLGVFPGLLGGPSHENLGASDEWADLEKFEQKARAIVMERFRCSTLLEQMRVSEDAMRYYRLPRPYAAGMGSPTPTESSAGKQSPTKRWQFWKT